MFSLNRIIVISIPLFVFLFTGQALCEKSVSYYVNQVNNKTIQVKNHLPKINFGAENGQKEYDMLMGLIKKMDTQCDKIKKHFKLTNPKTYDYISVERARENVKDLETQITRKYEKETATAKNLKKSVAKSGTGGIGDIEPRIKQLYEKYEMYKPVLSSPKKKKSKKNKKGGQENGSIVAYQKILEQIDERLSSFDSDKEFVVALNAMNEWKNKSEVRKLYQGFTSTNKSYNYKMKLGNQKDRILRDIDVTRSSTWERHVKDLDKTPEQLYEKWGRNTPALVKQVDKLQSSIDFYASVSGQDGTWKKANQICLKLKSNARKTYEIYIATVKAPEDKYNGSDRKTLKKETQEKWLSYHKNSKILSIRLPAQAWKRNVSFNVTEVGTYLAKIEKKDMSAMPVAVIVKGEKDRAVIYWGRIYKSNLDGRTAYVVYDGSPPSKWGYVIEEMLAENL